MKTMDKAHARKCAQNGCMISYNLRLSNADHEGTMFHSCILGAAEGDRVAPRGRRKTSLKTPSVVTIAVIGGVLGATSAAQAGPAFECTMTNRLDQKDKMNLTFIVTDKDKGMVVGNAGTAELIVSRSSNGFNFFEFTSSGNVMLATVVAPAQLPVTTTTPPVKYPVIYSRHTVIIEPVPSQYQGECVLKN